MSEPTKHSANPTLTVEEAYEDFLRAVSELRGNHRPRHSARRRILAHRSAAPGLPGLHRRLALRRVATAQPSGAAALGRLRQSALRESRVGGHDRARRTGAALRADAIFTPAPEDYIVVFTANATGALKLVGESYPFAPGSRCLLAFDNHNSVNGIREFAHARGAEVNYAPLTVPELRVDRPRLEALLAQADPGKANLFAYPAQSNFSGVRHPLELVAKGAEQRLGCPAGRGGAGADQPAGSERGAAGLCDCRSTKCSATRRAWALC